MQPLSYSEKEIDTIAKAIIQNATTNTFCFYGEMGAGKTTLIKELVKQLGGSDKGHSPTFGLVNEYHLANGDLLGYHFDFYRLNDELEAYDMGFEDYLNQDCWIFIEWPEKIASLIPKDAIHIKIELVDAVTRKISIIEQPTC